MKIERLSGLEKLAVQDPTLTPIHLNPFAVIARSALHTSLVELRRKKLASLWHHEFLHPTVHAPIALSAQSH